MGSAKKAAKGISGKSATDRLGGAVQGALVGAQAGGPWGALAGAVGGAAVGQSGIRSGVKEVTDKLKPGSVSAAQIDPSTEQLTTTTTDANARNAALGSAIAASQAQRNTLTTPQMQAQMIDRSQIGNVGASSVGPGTAVGMDVSGVQRVGAQTGAQMQNTQIQTADQAQMREQQLALGAQLQAQAAGTAPSVAEMQAKKAGERALAAQMAMQAGQTGSASALAQRTAARNQASIGADIASQSAVLRLQEQQQAQKALGDLSGQVRGQDIGLASQQAQLEQTTKTANLQAQVADFDRGLRADLANQGVDLDKAKMDAANGNAMALANLQVATQNADRLLKADLANQGVDLDVLKANAAAGNAAAQANLAASLQKMGLDDAMSRAYMQNQLDLNKQQTDQVMQTLTIQSQEKIAQAGLTQQAKLANAAASSSMTGGLMSAGAALGAAYIAKSDENYKTNIAKDEEDQKKKKDKEDKESRKRFADAVRSIGSKPEQQNPEQQKYGAIAKIGEALINKYVPSDKKEDTSSSTSMSDETNKENKTKQTGRLKDFLGSLDVYSYDYKDPKFGEGRQTSVMAQDLEKSDIGQRAIIETDEGKSVDYAKLLPAMLAANVDANKRITTLEQALRAKKGSK